jgi:hypothetical protein
VFYFRSRPGRRARFAAQPKGIFVRGQTNTQTVTKKQAGPRDYGRPVSARIDRDDCTRLSLLARVYDTSPADQARRALETYFERRSNDPLLPEQIERAKRRYAQTLEVLRPDAKPPAQTPKTKATKDVSNAEQMTLRVDAATYSRLSAFCLVDEDTLADQFRRAVSEMLDVCWDDPWIRTKVARLRADLDEVFAEDNVNDHDAGVVTEVDVDAAQSRANDHFDKVGDERALAIGFEPNESRFG